MKISVPHLSRKAATRGLAVHALCWLAYIAIELYVLHIYEKRFEPAYVYVLFYALNISLFYGVIWSLKKDRYLSRGKNFLQGLSRLLAILVLYLVLKLCLNRVLYGQRVPLGFQFTQLGNFIFSSLYRGYLFVVPAVFYWLAGHLAGFKPRELELERAQLISSVQRMELEAGLERVKNEFFQQQLDPHLVANSINFVYSTVQGVSADGARMLVLLSEVLRYSMNEAAADHKVPLAAEIAQVQNLVEINRYRAGQGLQLEVAIEGDMEKHRFIPLILLTLTENMFKHGNLRDARCPALLRIRVSADGQLAFLAANLKKNTAGIARPSGTGLRNIRARLGYSYPRAYHLDIREGADIYEIELNVDL